MKLLTQTWAMVAVALVGIAGVVLSPAYAIQILSFCVSVVTLIQALKIHKLVNSAMGRSLKISAVFARRIANTSGTPADVETADIAEAEYREYQERQAAVDAEK